MNILSHQGIPFGGLTAADMTELRAVTPFTRLSPTGPYNPSQ